MTIPLTPYNYLSHTLDSLAKPLAKENRDTINVGQLQFKITDGYSEHY
jgi:hypothetical protein